jgi:hypothetical protein
MGNMEIIKWAGTIICLFGIAFTSLNIYPINIYFGLVGSFLWTYSGYLQKDFALLVVEGAATFMYASGLWMNLK